jgi:hypothetical protein
MITKRRIEEASPVKKQNGQTNYAEHRKHLVEWVRSQLTGLVSEEGRRLGIRSPGRYVDEGEIHEIMRGIAPTDRYPSGVLYPVYRGAEGIDPVSEIQDDEDDELNAADYSADQTPVTVIKPRRYMPPSSVGFSFFVRGETIELQVLCSAVRYKKKLIDGNSVVARDEEGRFTENVWHRIPLANSDGEVNTFSAPAFKKNVTSREPIRERINVLSDRAGIDVLWRPFADGWITTVSMFNKYELSAEGDHKILSKLRNENSLFEVGLRCVFDTGEVGVYPRVDKSLLTEEEQEIELQYKHRHIYAVGHGAAVNWTVKKEEGGDKVKEITAEFFPSVEVPQVTADVADGDNRALQLSYLASVSTTKSRVFADLDDFKASYANWVEDQKLWAAAIPSDEQGAASRIVERMSVAVSRMKQGLSILQKDQCAQQSFALANQTMLDQMMQYDRAQGKAKSPELYCWRPFQLAFLLSDIESVVNEDSDFRDTVDLIWFPTGGGKTEAYLGLIAFLIVWRRLTNQASGGGTTVIMRYTLRLLTAQQYLRATRMICALELIRRKTPALGKEPITIGMWVGAATSPNTLKTAKQAVDKAADGNGAAPMELVLRDCPWCGESFIAPDNYVASPTKFHFRCTNQDCDFGQTVGGIIPCNVVDEALYADPPTLLIATIDKFARLAWEERTNAFFGNNGNRPPELVVQDELHLIAGALGTIAGLYEAALDTVLVQRGIHPKYIASTATIRMADQQVRRLYGKDVAVFPPPGLSCEDSYFARTVPLSEKPGRLYVGYLAPMLGRQPIGKTPSNIVPLAAALLLVPEVIFADQEDRNALLDAWWTQVVYHGSLRGVGSSHNAFSNDVREYLRRYSEEVNEANRKDPKTKDVIERHIARISQLTSLSSAEENARTFACLERSRKNPECLDAVLATNMISVGLDVARLALMIVNGQPLTTAEYIQASSRVGRSDVPGVVFANYYRDQTRSLSHYENFRPYHESFYRFVEPTSVTPYTYQARLRALHAALVIAVRHSCGHLLANNKAGSFNPTDEIVAKTIETLKNRCRHADKDRSLETSKHIDKLVYEWKTEVEMCKASKRQLNYQGQDKVTDRLLHNHDNKIKGRWATLQSMRNAENTAFLVPL